jgi:hypothetical protein
MSQQPREQGLPTAPAPDIKSAATPTDTQDTSRVGQNPMSKGERMI